jgi:pterin-4a-carbinolamine dehydratase
MWTIKHLIGDYEESEIKTGDTSKLPIEATGRLRGWKLKEDPRRYTRVFKFSDETKFNSFIIDILELHTETGHHSRITAQYPQVKLEIWTHTLNDVTEVDGEWCAKVSDIFGDYSHDS